MKDIKNKIYTWIESENSVETCMTDLKITGLFSLPEVAFLFICYVLFYYFLFWPNMISAAGMGF